MKAPTTFIALLRGINVGGRNILPMADLRLLCAGLGWEDVQSYIQSGNLVFRAEDGPAVLETRLEAAVTARFGLDVPVIVRTAAEWTGFLAANPFPAESQREPKFVHLALAKLPLRPDAAERLQERAQDGERVVQAGDALWIHYAGGAGKSKLTPALLDRFAGSPVTARNWNTVLQIEALAHAVG